MTPTWLPDEPLFPLPVADSRAPLSAVTLRFEDSLVIDATLAADFPIVNVSFGETRPLRLGFGVAAGAYMGFDPSGELTFQLQTFDGLFAFPLDLAWGPLRARLQWAHLSAHFADGVRDDPELRDRRDAFSREWVQLQVAGLLGPASVYGGSRLILHAEDEVDPFGVQVGGMIAGPWVVAPYAAVDLQIYGEQGWRPALAGQVGAQAHLRRTRFRLGAAARYGAEDTGQLYDLDEAWIGMVFGFDRTGAIAK